jgi:NADH-quinone oxidoreductase subunit L/multicomponent Na+:H+ antiporter subunit D
MAGIGKRMPLTMTAFAVAAAGMAGIPLVAGFVSKWYLLIGSVEAGQAIFAGALLLSGVLNIAYFWPIVYQAFFESADDHDSKPLLEGPLGGRFAAETKATEEKSVAADGGHDDPDHDSHADTDESDHHGGPGPGGWDERRWNGDESTWFMLGPILTAATGALALGIAPAVFVFLRLVKLVAENVGVMA